jgi:hypothetical protein
MIQFNYSQRQATKTRKGQRKSGDENQKVIVQTWNDSQRMSNDLCRSSELQLTLMRDAPEMAHFLAATNFARLLMRAGL